MSSHRVLASALIASLGIGTGIATDRYLFPYIEQQSKTIRNPDVSGRVISRNGVFVDGTYIQDYQILTSEGEMVWGILPYDVNTSDPSFNSDNLPRHILEVGNDVRVKFSGKSQIPAMSEWVYPADKDPSGTAHPFMLISGYEKIKTVEEKRGGEINGIVTDRQLHAYNGKENVFLEEYTVLDKAGEIWYCAKKHTLADPKTTQQPDPLFRVGNAVTVQWDQFSLDGETYYKKEGFDIMGMDGFGTRREKVIWGIHSYTINNR